MLILKISELEKIKEDMTRQLQYNDDIKLHLYEVRSSIFQRLYGTNSELDKQTDKNVKLEQKINQEIQRYQEMTEDKDEEIENKLRKIADLQTVVSEKYYIEKYLKYI